MESNDKLKTMNVNKEILMTIVRNSGVRLVGDQEILEISEKQLATISRELTKLFSIGSVSNTFKAKIQADIDEAKRTLKSTKENTAYSFEDATGWVKEMNLIKGEIQGLTKALNCC